MTALAEALACEDTPRDDGYLDDEEAERNAFADGRSAYEPPDA